MLKLCFTTVIQERSVAKMEVTQVAEGMELYLIYSTFCSGCMHVVLSLLIYNIMDNLFFFLNIFIERGRDSDILP